MLVSSTATALLFWLSCISNSSHWFPNHQPFGNMHMTAICYKTK